MAIRLYPRTRDPAALERLCGVPAGTHAVLAAWEAGARQQEGEDYRDWCQRYDKAIDALADAHPR